MNICIRHMVATVSMVLWAILFLEGVHFASYVDAVGVPRAQMVKRNIVKRLALIPPSDVDASMA